MIYDESLKSRKIISDPILFLQIEAFSIATIINWSAKQFEEDSFKKIEEKKQQGRFK